MEQHRNGVIRQRGMIRPEEGKAHAAQAEGRQGDAAHVQAVIEKGAILQCEKKEQVVEEKDQYPAIESGDQAVLGDPMTLPVCHVPDTDRGQQGTGAAQPHQPERGLPRFQLGGEDRRPVVHQPRIEGMGIAHDGNEHRPCRRHPIDVHIVEQRIGQLYVVFGSS